MIAWPSAGCCFTLVRRCFSLFYRRLPAGCRSPCDVYASVGRAFVSVFSSLFSSVLPHTRSCASLIFVFRFRLFCLLYASHKRALGAFAVRVSSFSSCSSSWVLSFVARISPPSSCVASSKGVFCVISVLSSPSLLLLSSFFFYCLLDYPSG